MSRLLPAPILSGVLLLSWLLLNGFSMGHLVLGSVVALVLPVLLRRTAAEPVRIRRPLVLGRLAVVVLKDIVLANIDVARRILGPESRIRPAFFWVPLDVTRGPAISALAGIITMTPGTLSAEVTADRKYLLVHCFHVDDVAAVVADIKARYEAPLKEALE
jgi:multicomponent K+:H+ antiporter subunit E